MRSRPIKSSEFETCSQGRGDQGLRDLALFSVAIDTMLQGPELLNLTVTDVRRSDGNIRSVIEVARSLQEGRASGNC
jgi:hypothetical protein